MPTYRIQNGDCRAELKSLADCSIDSVVTDPPYELGFMGKSWDRSGIAYQVEVWRECLRVLKPGGYLLAFGGSRTYHRLACAIEDAGFEIRDQIQWLYGSGFPKSLNIGAALDKVNGEPRERVPHPKKPQGPRGVCFAQDEWTRNMVGVLAPDATTENGGQWNGWGTALKPAHEPIALARKPLIGTVAENVLAHGIGGLNIDGCRIECTTGDKGDWPITDRPAKTNVLDDGLLEHAGTNHAIGRWPANVIHDGSDEVVTLFPVSDANGYRANPSTVDLSDAVVGYSGDAIRGERGHNDTGSAARFFYCAKASREDREDGLDFMSNKRGGPEQFDSRWKEGTGENRQPIRSNGHPTVKPTDLMRYLCRLVTPPNGTVLDPFCGSGSTGRGAILEGLNFMGIEIDAEYCELAEKRIEVVTRQGMFMFA